MSYNFDTVINRRASDSIKWKLYNDDVLPLWVADMDFAAPQEILDAMHERVDHGIFGYVLDSPELRELIVERMQRLYNWTIQSDEILFLPGLVSVLMIIGKAYAEPGDKILLQPPVYPPFLNSPKAFGQIPNLVPLIYARNGNQITYEIDFDAFEAAIDDRTKMFFLCNPHNPIGRGFTPAELTRFAEICERHNLLICSDDIHCDLLLGGAKHTPIASLSPEISNRTITLMAPSKTFNLAGLGCSFAIIQNAELRQKLQTTTWGLLPFVNVMAYAAAVGAYKHGQQWLDELLVYLQGNRDYLCDYVEQHFPAAAITRPTATYLAWMDCRQLGLEDPYKFFLENAKVGLTSGKDFGQEGEGFVRLNLACPRGTLEEALERMRAAIEGLKV